MTGIVTDHWTDHWKALQNNRGDDDWTSWVYLKGGVDDAWSNILVPTSIHPFKGNLRHGWKAAWGLATLAVVLGFVTQGFISPNKQLQLAEDVAFGKTNEQRWLGGSTGEDSTVFVSIWICRSNDMHSKCLVSRPPPSVPQRFPYPSLAPLPPNLFPGLTSKLLFLANETYWEEGTRKLMKPCGFVFTSQRFRFSCIFPRAHYTLIPSMS